jgi:hypothetical protein
MELVVVNGSNAIARGVISKLAGKNYQKIRFLDYRPYRKSVYSLQRSLPAGVQLEKHQVQTHANLELALEGAKDVLYFTHDYFASSSDKNNFIQATAKVSKSHGVEKLIAVCPIEHELYWSEDKHTPFDVIEDAQQKALQNFDKLTILNTNLVFGRDSYLVHYMTQCAAAGRIPKSIGGSKSYEYKPVSSDDLTAAVESALGKSSEVQGQRFSVNGEQGITLNDLLHLIERQVGKDQGSTSLKGSLLGLGLSDYVEEFFTGITHDKNMGRFAEYMDAHTPNLEGHSPDFHRKFGLAHKVKVQDYFGAKTIKESDLVFPIFTDYKMVSLD